MTSCLVFSCMQLLHDIFCHPKPLDHSLPAGDDVDEGKLDKGEEDETGADEEPDVDELDVGHLRQVGSTGAVEKNWSQASCLIWKSSRPI